MLGKLTDFTRFSEIFYFVVCAIPVSFGLAKRNSFEFLYLHSQLFPSYGSNSLGSFLQSSHDYIITDLPPLSFALVVVNKLSEHIDH